MSTPDSQRQAARLWLKAMAAYKDGDLVRAGRWLTEAQALASDIEVVQRFSSEYLTYLDSPQWKAFRLRCLVNVYFQCQRCGRPPEDGNPLDLHHKHYRTLGREHPEDVEVLCRACHMAEHGQ